jgi:putative flippase GtrA
MEKIKAILRDRDKLREVVLYLIFGVLTTLVSWGVYYVWRQLFKLSEYPTDSVQYTLIANSGQVVAFILSVIFAFVTNKGMVFRSTKKGSGLWKEIGLFFSARVLGWVIFDIALFNLLLSLTKSTLPDADLWIKLLMNVLVVLFNYAASKFVIFKK